MTSTEHLARGRRAHDLRAVVSHRYKFVYVPVPKCGTTTMDRVLHVVHGIEDSEHRIDTDLADRYAANHKPRRDVETLLVQVNYIGRFRTQFSDYAWISIVRDPYDRLISIYNYDVRRYAKYFDRKTYLYAGLIKRAAFVLGRDPQTIQRSVIRRRIGFDKFVRGLQRSGTDFDIHFMRQTDLLFYDFLSYDYLINIDRLASDLPPLLRRLGVQEEFIERLTPFPRSNPSRASDASYDEATRALAYQLYKPDFAALLP